MDNNQKSRVRARAPAAPGRRIYTRPRRGASVRAAPEREPEKRCARAEARARGAQVRTPKRKSRRSACQSHSSLQPGKEVGGESVWSSGPTL
jgi:hypothetical protein